MKSRKFWALGKKFSLIEDVFECGWVYCCVSNTVIANIMSDLPAFSLGENDCNELFITQTSRNDVGIGVHEVQSSCEVSGGNLLGFEFFLK